MDPVSAMRWLSERRGPCGGPRLGLRGLSPLEGAERVLSPLRTGRIPTYGRVRGTKAWITAKPSFTGIGLGKERAHCAAPQDV